MKVIDLPTEVFVPVSIRAGALFVTAFAVIYTVTSQYCPGRIKYSWEILGSTHETHAVLNCTTESKINQFQTS